MYGKATGPDLDLDQQIIDPDFLARGMPAWFDSGANVRQMHSTNLPPAGKGVELVRDGDDWHLKTRVVEPVAVKLVREGVYQAYSVGIAHPRIVRDQKARNGRIVDGEIVENSLVDRPANPTAKFAQISNKTLGFVGKVLVSGALEQAQEAAWSAWLYPEAMLYKKDYSDQQRAQFAKDGKAIPIRNDDGEIVGGAFPINDRADLEDAISAYGRAGNKPEAKAHIIRQAQRLGAEDMIPDKWRKTKSKAASMTTATEAEKAKAPAFDGAAPPFGAKPDADADDQPAGGADAKPDAVKPPTKAKKNKATKSRKGGKRGKNYPGQETPPLMAAYAANAKAVGAEVPYAAKRLHDAYCQVYKWQDVEETYPGLVGKNGVAASMGGLATQAIYAMLQQEVSEDAGTGDGAEDIHEVATAYKALCCFLDAEGSEDIYQQARGQLHKLFRQANKGIADVIGGSATGTPDLPKPGDPIQPGSYRRGYLSAGHAAMTASGSGPRMPVGNGTTGSAFDRGPLTAGHERPSPASKSEQQTHAPGELGKAARKALAADAAWAMQALHDRLVTQHPGVCALGTTIGKRAAVGEGIMAEAKEPSAETMPNKQSSKPGKKNVPDAKASPTESEGASVKAAKRAAKAAKKMRATLQRSIKRQNKSAKKALTPLHTQLVKMQTDIDALASAPDPARSPFRGVMGERRADGSVDKASAAEETLLQKRASDEQAAHIAFLQRIANSGSVDAVPAQEQLTAQGVAW